MRFCFPGPILLNTWCSNLRNNGPRIKKFYFFANCHLIFLDKFYVAFCKCVLLYWNIYYNWLKRQQRGSTAPLLHLKANRDTALHLSLSLLHFLQRRQRDSTAPLLLTATLYHQRQRDSTAPLLLTAALYQQRPRDSTAPLLLTATLYQQRQRDSTVPLLLLHLANRHRETALPLSLSPLSHCNTEA